jgi:putative endonuclease
MACWPLARGRAAARGAGRPAIHEIATVPGPLTDFDHGGWLGLHPHKPALYVGVTDNLARRIWKHREGVVEGFTKRYGLKRLVYAEHHGDICLARQREQNIKHCPRAGKVRLILVSDPNWEDRYDRLG